MARHVIVRLTKRAAELIVGIIDEHVADTFETHPPETWKDHDVCDDICREEVSDAWAVSRAKDAIVAALDAELRA